MKINFILPRPTLSGGIISNGLIAEALARRGHDVHLYYVAAPAKRPPLREPANFARYIKRQIFDHQRPLALQSRLVSYIPVHSSHIRASDVRNADITIATWWETRHWVEDYPATKGAKAYFIRHYETFGGPQEEVDATYRMPGMRFVIATWLQDLLKQRFNIDDAVLIPNGVDRSVFIPDERATRDVPTVGVTYSRLEWKGLDDAFKAIRQAQSTVTNLHVVSFGAHPLRRYQQRPRNLIYKRAPSRHEIASLYRSAHVWLVPSLSEGFGMPGLEAAACGTPVIATMCGGPSDYVSEGENGYMVPVGDWKTMADRIVRIVTLPHSQWTAMSKASVQVSLRFDWDASAERLEHAIVQHLNR